jgi:hypothetical protein
MTRTVPFGRRCAATGVARSDHLLTYVVFRRVLAARRPGGEAVGS